MGISAMLLSLEGGEETTATATVASIATATASAVARPPPSTSAMLSSPDAVVAAVDADERDAYCRR